MLSSEVDLVEEDEENENAFCNQLAVGFFIVSGEDNVVGMHCTVIWSLRCSWARKLRISIRKI